MSAATYAYYSVLPEMYGPRHDPPKRKTRAKIAFTELIRPDGYWPQPYSIEQAFQVYRWFVRTGKPFTDGDYNPYDLLIGRGVLGSGDFHYEGICSLAELRRRFHRAILGRSNGRNTSEWRHRERIAYGQERIIGFPHYAPFDGSPVCGKVLSEAQIKKLLDAYFGAKGKLAVQLNSVHADAVDIVHLEVNVSTYQGCPFLFRLLYGVDGSAWWHELASGEQFLDTFSSALDEFGRVSGQNLLKGIGR